MRSRDSAYHFLEDEKLNELYECLDEFINGDVSAEDFLRELKELLPLQKGMKEAVNARVEGFYLVSDLLFYNVQIELRDKIGATVNRERIIKEAKLRPFSYYHWLTGSREPIANVMTRDDFFNDPSTALVKLEDDILKLAKLYRESRERVVD